MSEGLPRIVLGLGVPDGDCDIKKLYVASVNG